MGERGSMKEVFVQCQTGLQGHGKLMKTLQKIYDKTEFEAFWSEFNHYLKYAMVVFKREPAVERMIDFVSKFAPTLCKKSIEKGADGDADTSQEDEGDSVADNRLLQEMFDFLLSSHSARDRGVRFRCCQLINKLLTNLGEDAQIDDELYDRLYECMLERLKDKCPMVRYHAVLAMARLQDPSDENCPVIRAYLFLLNCDPNADVRRAVLSSIAPSTKTLSSIIGRTRDVKDTVRKTAYEVLSEKIHIKALSIALRLQLINEGLKDRSDMVQQACSGKLLQVWLRTFGGNVMEVLKSLDVEDSTDVCSKVLETLFKATSVQDMVSSFNILDEHLLIPLDALSGESALYWQAACKFIHAMGTEGDEYMEKVMPTVVDFCAYMQRYIDELKTVEDPEIQLGREFIIEQLLLITSYMDTADAASKKALETLLHNMLMADHVSHRLVKSIIVRICTLRGTGDNMVAYFAEMVSEIREPITIVQKDVEEEQQRQINLKIAGIRVQLNQLREDLEDAVKTQDFARAGEIKATIAQLDAEKNQLLETSEPVREEVRTEKNDPLTLLKCQTIISEMLQQLKLNNVSPTLQMMIESQIVPGIQNEDAEVRNMAMQALGLCCYLSKDLLLTYIPLFMQASQIDVEGVRVTALRVLFDLLLIYGLEIVDASEGSSNDSLDNATSTDVTTSDAASASSDSRSGTASKLVAIVCSFLDGDSSELRTCAAEGLSKLLLSGRVVSSKILSHLILLWYNPLSEDDTHLRDCLGTFFPLYALASRANQETVEEAFLPTLRTLLNAPATSPLAEVDVNNVAELLVQLTNTKLLTANQNSPEKSMDNPGHDNLSETVCNEILSNPSSSHVKLWVRILNQMEMSPDNEVVLKDLRILAYKMVMTVKEKTSLKALQKFQDRINELASKFVSGTDDLQNVEIEPVQPETEAMEDAPQDTSIQTPKRKRVRGLYSQNMTLAMESESELDIEDESTVEIDASCLMSHTSVETPSRRGRKNTTTTELAEEDVFIAPGETLENEPATKSGNEEETTAAEEPEALPEPEVENQNKVTSPQKKKDASPSKAKSPRSKSPEKRGRPMEKKSPRGSEQKSPDKRKASKSPANASPEKRIASDSPAKSSQEKRKASKSPGREKKRMSKSPARSTSAKGSKSPDKAVKTPVKETTELKDKSPKKTLQNVNPKSKSPARGSTEKRKSAGSPVKSDGKKGDKSSPAPAKKAKESGKTGKSPVKNIKDTVKAQEKGKPEVKDKKGQSPERKKSASKVTDTKEKKAAEKNTRKAVPKTVESPALGKTRSVASTSVEKSPRRARGAKTSDSGTPKSNDSPKKASKVGNKMVADTPEQTARRATRSGLDTPDANSPRRRRAGATSVAETPEHIEAGKLSKKAEPKKTAPVTAKGAVTRHALPRPAVKLNDIGKTGRNITRGSPRVAGRNVDGRKGASSASSASESSPEKSTKVTRTAKGRLGSSADSSASSPDSMKGKKPTAGKASPAVQNRTVEVGATTDEDEEEVTLRRKAKPSRRSATASSSAAAATPPVANRATRASLSQSSVDSPATKSPARPRPGVPKAAAKDHTPTKKQTARSAPVRRSTRGDTDESSQESSTLSLISSQKSASSSQRSTTASQRSTTSTVSSRSQASTGSRPSSRAAATTTKTAGTRSQSADSSKKPTAIASKVTRSVIPTRVTRQPKGSAADLKRSLRSKPSDKK